MKNESAVLLAKLNMLGEDNYLSDFSRVNYFFKQFDEFLVSLLPNRPATLRPAHYARLLPKSAWPNYEKLFIKHGYSVSNRFPSTIVQAYFGKKYPRESISIEIVKISGVDKQEIELLVVDSKLDREIVEQENLNLRHFALTLEEKDFADFVNVLLQAGFKKVFSGNNQYEQSSTTYFQKNFDNNSLRLEIFKKV